MSEAVMGLTLKSGTESSLEGMPQFLFAVLTPTAAARYLEIPETVLLAEASAGRVPAKQIQGEWRFLRFNLIQWFQSARKPVDFLAKTAGSFPEETPEEQAAFWATILANRDEVDRVTGSGKYAPE